MVASYYVEGIGTTNQAAVAKYIDEQRAKEVTLYGYEDI